MKDWRSKDRRLKDRRLKDGRSKDGRLKDRRSKDGRSKDLQTGKTIFNANQPQYEHFSCHGQSQPLLRASLALSLSYNKNVPLYVIIVAKINDDMT